MNYKNADKELIRRIGQSSNINKILILSAIL